jgi:cytochrome c-type biogenesis protein CcmH/NrfG
MIGYIWDFTIIGAVVLIFLVLARRLPVAAQFQKKEEKKSVSPQKVVAISAMSQADDAFEAKDFNKAESFYIKVAAAEPDNAKVYSRLGTIYLEQKNYYDAKDAFLQAIKLEPSNIFLEINLGTAYFNLKDFFKASQAFMKAVQEDPKNKKYRELYEKAQKALEKEKKARKQKF